MPPLFIRCLVSRSYNSGLVSARSSGCPPISLPLPHALLACRRSPCLSLVSLTHHDVFVDTNNVRKGVMKVVLLRPPLRAQPARDRAVVAHCVAEPCETKHTTTRSDRGVIESWARNRRQERPPQCSIQHPRKTQGNMVPLTLFFQASEGTSRNKSSPQPPNPPG